MSDDQFAPPTSEILDHAERVYAGFWRRVGASLIDTILAILVIAPLMYMLFGVAYFESEELFPGDGLSFTIEYLLPLVLTVFFWTKFRATPGKMLFGCEVVSLETGETIGIGRSLLRYVGYFVSSLPLCLGFIWVAFNQRKRGWHDYIAGTVVVRRL